METRPVVPKCLENHRIEGLPSSAYYIPNFITSAEEQLLLDKIRHAPARQWTSLARRRLQVYPSRLTAKNILIAAPLPTWLLDPITTRLKNIPVSHSPSEGAQNHIFASSPHNSPNHVLINEYEPGQGIMPHEDGAAYWPVVATVSLAAAVVLDIYGKEDGGREERQPKWRLLQEPRSLLITTDKLYTQHLHGIAEETVDENLMPGSIVNWHLLGVPEDFISGLVQRRTRISLTYRDVLNVSNIGSKLKLFSR